MRNIKVYIFPSSTIWLKVHTLSRIEGLYAKAEQVMEGYCTCTCRLQTWYNVYEQMPSHPLVAPPLLSFHSSNSPEIWYTLWLKFYRISRYFSFAHLSSSFLGALLQTPISQEQAALRHLIINFDPLLDARNSTIFETVQKDIANSKSKTNSKIRRQRQNRFSWHVLNLIDRDIINKARRRRNE